MKLKFLPFKLSNIKLNKKIKSPQFRVITISILVFTLLLAGIFVFTDKNTNNTIIENNTESTDHITEESILMTANNTDDNELQKAYGLYIDDEFIAAVENEEQITSLLDKLLKAKLSSLPINNVTSAQFKNEILIESGEFNPEYIVDSSRLGSLLGMENEYSFTFKICSITNEKVDNKLSLIIKSTEQREVDIPFSTNYIDTNAKQSGYQKVVCSGENGTATETYELVYIDDNLIETNYVSTDVIEDSTTKVVERGVLTEHINVNSLGILSPPYDGRISSGFGWRSLGYHEGIDIIANSGSCYGDDVYAAGDGIVTEAGRRAGLGIYVNIDCGNGIVIVYGHLKSYSVKEGDYVNTGDVVGQIGVTGRTTGPHLHFEVIHDGKKVNPLLYLDMD